VNCAPALLDDEQLEHVPRPDPPADEPVPPAPGRCVGAIAKWSEVNVFMLSSVPKV